MNNKEVLFSILSLNHTDILCKKMNDDDFKSNCKLSGMEISM